MVYFLFFNLLPKEGCVFTCVCLYARLLINLWTDFDELFRRVRGVAQATVRFCWLSMSWSRSNNFWRILCLLLRFQVILERSVMFHNTVHFVFRLTVVLYSYFTVSVKTFRYGMTGAFKNLYSSDFINNTRYLVTLFAKNKWQFYF